MTASAIYEGTIRHRRFAVRSREFKHRVALMYLDLDELASLFGGRLQSRRPGLVRFRRDEYLGYLREQSLVTFRCTLTFASVADRQCRA